MKAAEYTLIVGVIPKEGRGGPRQSFFGYNNDNYLAAHFPMTQLNQSLCSRGLDSSWVIIGQEELRGFVWGRLQEIEGKCL